MTFTTLERRCPDAVIPGRDTSASRTWSSVTTLGGPDIQPSGFQIPTYALADRRLEVSAPVDGHLDVPVEPQQWHEQSGAELIGLRCSSPTGLTS